MYTYKQLVSMVMRLHNAGMAYEKAVTLVAHNYGADADALMEYVNNHIIQKGA